MTPPQILIVDDDATMRQILQAQLAAEGYRLEFAINGAEAIARIATAPPPALVICDVMMPEVDGLEVCRAIRESKQWRLVPVVLLTALDEADDLCRGLEAGADEFLTKPIDSVVLRARTRAILRIRDRYDEQEAPAPRKKQPAQLSRRETIIAQAGLTAREREVLDLILLGRTHGDIATVLAISKHTCKFHQANLLRKLGAESRIDLIRLFL